MRKPSTLAAAAILAAAVTPLAACGSSSPSTQTVKGQVMGGTSAASTTMAALGGSESICAGAVTGTQVIIKSPSGKLLATTNLTKDTAATAKLHLPAVISGPEGQVGIYTFTTTIPAGTGPYTVDIVGVSSLVVSTSQLGHLTLTCGG